MCRVFRALVVAFWFLAAGGIGVALDGGGAAQGKVPAPELARRIDALLRDPQLHGAQVGVDIVKLTPQGPTSLYRFHPTVALMPGSNAKLLTTAAAFDRLGPHAVIATRLYRVGDHLVLVGGGDPALGDPVLCHRAGWQSTTVFQQWANHLRALGLTHFHDIVVDDSIFNHDFVNARWPLGGAQYLDWYDAPVGGLNFALNCIRWRPVIDAHGAVGLSIKPFSAYPPVAIQAHRGPAQRFWLWRGLHSAECFLRGSVQQSDPYWRQTTIADPGLYTGAVLRQVLVDHGIQITGSVRRGGLDSAATAPGTKPQLLATYETPLTAILYRANTDSINLMAEALCKLLGHLATGQPGGWANGTAAVQAYLRSLGIPTAWVQLVDGSGLSHLDHVAPAALIQVLVHIAMERDGKIFIDSMCRPGHGTLIYRFRGSPAAPHVRAKDGHITGASTLSGYLFAPDGVFVFSIMCNHYHGNVNGWQDRLVTALFNAESAHPR